MAEVGGMIASAIGKHITSKLGELVKEEIALLWGFKDEIEGMREKMEDLEAVMHDADERMCRGEKDGKAVSRWLAKFKSVAYDVEDVLDDLDATDLIENTQSKVKIFFSKNNKLLQRSTIAHNLKIVKEKIDHIEKDGQILNLVRREARANKSRNMETFAASNNEGTTGMVGRDTEKEKIISLLQKSEHTEDISIIPIVGLGGLGKSTLAESVLADQRVKIFDVVVWVHVSNLFDLHNIGCAIMKIINSSINLDNCTLQFLHDSLKKELTTTRYLIVLDDLWEEDGHRLEELKRMLQYGLKGSKIVVTTRNKSVVHALSTGFLAKERKICPVIESDQINLDLLSPGDCWEVMKQKALGSDDEQIGLPDIGREIAAKCGGLPLVANSLGQVMFELRTVKAWEDIRDIKVDLGLREVHQALECLMLSYYYMKIEFKMCFTYLAAFPKGFVIDDHRLIKQWIALGYIHGDDEGERCINYLIGMSFLHINKSSLVNLGPTHAKVPRELNMHDLVHDLASIITTNEFLVLDANSTNPSCWNRARYCRHAQLINYHNQPNVFKNLPAMARSLHFRDSGKQQLPRMAFSRSRYMRVLDLSGRSVGRPSNPSNLDLAKSSVEEQSTSSSIVLPSSIRQSKLLRYLDATSLPIISLPNSFHTLKYMETLILSKCSLETLPQNICNLHKLCYLDLSGNITLVELPVSLGNLSKLSFLNLSGCFKLQQLPDSIYELACLRHLNMAECRVIEKLPHKFGHLLKLIFLSLSGCSKLTKLPHDLRLVSLEHLDLSSCHELENLPRDFGNLQNLVFLSLSDCYKVSVLPESFCQLIRLKELNFSDCHDLSELPHYFGNLSELNSLNLTSCSKLQVLPESLCKLFKLRLLNISYCKRLEKLSSTLGVLNLELLDISSTNLSDLPDTLFDMTTLTQLVFSSAEENVYNKALEIKKQLNLPVMIQHNVHEIENKSCSSIVELAQLNCRELRVGQLENVKHPEFAEKANLRDKSDLRELYLSWGLQAQEGKSVLERLIPPRTLDYFFLGQYMSKDFPNWMSHISTYLPSLTHLILSNLGACDNLPPLGQLPNLRSLVMENIPNIIKIGKEFYGDGGACRKLRAIQLVSMDNLVEWWTTLSGQEHKDFLIPNLHELEISDCPKLKFLPYAPRSMFWHMANSSMYLPKEGFGKLFSSSLPFQMVVDNCTFAPHEWDRLKHLPTLEIIDVYCCNELRAFPEAMRCLTSLRRLSLRSLKDLEILPVWLGNLTSLQELKIFHCPNLNSLPETMTNLTALRSLHLMGWQGVDVLPEGSGQLTSLQDLHITDCPNLTSLPESMKSLTTLRKLWLAGCSGLDVLPEGMGQLSSLQELRILDCPSLTSLPESLKNLTALIVLWLMDCSGLVVLPEGLGQLTCLQDFRIMDCPNLTYLPESMKNLTTLTVLALCGGLDVLPEWLGKLTLLEQLSTDDCPNLTSLPESMKNLSSLRVLQLSGCKGLDVLPEWLGQLTSLQDLRILDCPNLTSLPESMKNLTALSLVSLVCCNGLNVLPEWLGQLISLQEFNIVSCPDLTYLPQSIVNLTALKKLSISECPSLVERCQGEDSYLISHIPEVTLDDGEESGGSDDCNVES